MSVSISGSAVCNNIVAGLKTSHSFPDFQEIRIVSCSYYLIPIVHYLPLRPDKGLTDSPSLVTTQFRSRHPHDAAPPMEIIGQKLRCWPRDQNASFNATLITTEFNPRHSHVAGSTIENVGQRLQCRLRDQNDFFLGLLYIFKWQNTIWHSVFGFNMRFRCRFLWNAKKTMLLRTGKYISVCEIELPPAWMWSEPLTATERWHCVVSRPFKAEQM